MINFVKQLKIHLMKKTLFSVLLLYLFSNHAIAQIFPLSEKVVIRLKNNSLFDAKIIKDFKDSIFCTVNEKYEMKFAKKDLAMVEMEDKTYFKSKFWQKDKFSQQYFLHQNGSSLEKGELQYSNYLLFLNAFSYGFTDKISGTFGFVYVPNNNYAFIFIPRYSTKIDESTLFSIGIYSSLNSSDYGDNLNGYYYEGIINTSLTIQNNFKSRVSFGIGTDFGDYFDRFEYGNNFLINFSFSNRILPKIQLDIESVYRFPLFQTIYQSSFLQLNFVLKTISVKKYSFGAGVITNSIYDTYLKYNFAPVFTFLPIPILNFRYKIK